MGYILPIQQPEYTDYHKRMMTRKRAITSVEKPYKSALQSKSEELKQQEEIRNQKVNLILNEEEKPLTSLNEIDAIYTEITGLGKFINECV